MSIKYAFINQLPSLSGLNPTDEIFASRINSDGSYSTYSVSASALSSINNGGSDDDSAYFPLSAAGTMAYQASANYITSSQIASLYQPLSSASGSTGAYVPLSAAGTMTYQASANYLTSTQIASLYQPLSASSAGAYVPLSAAGTMAYQASASYFTAAQVVATYKPLSAAVTGPYVPLSAAGTMAYAASANYLLASQIVASYTPLSALVNLVTGVTGILPVSAGGLGQSSLLPNFISNGTTLAGLAQSTNNYVEFAIQNTSNGSSASSDFTATGNNGTATTLYIDLGFNSSGFTGAQILNLASAGYLYTAAADLVIGTLNSNTVHFVVNNSTVDSFTILPTGNSTFQGTISATNFIAPFGLNIQGVYGVSLSATGITNLTLPISGTLATLANISGSSGNIRSINSASTNTNMGNTLNTDYVYFVTGTSIMTLPTASSNSNMYTVTNIGAAVVTITTTGGQTINGSNPITITPGTSLDIMSNGSNWYVI